jgi:transposase
MAPKKKEHSNDLRTLVIKHYLNGDSQREIAAKTLLSRTTVQSMIKKYKSTKCIGNRFGRGRKRGTTATTDRLIQ